MRQVYYVMVFWISSVVLHGQIRSEFVLADSAFWPCIKLDSKARLHAVWTSEEIPRGLYYSLMDSFGHQLQPLKKVSSGGMRQRIALSGGIAVAVWKVSSGFWSEIQGQVFPSLGDSVLDRDILFDSDESPAVWHPDVAFLDDTTFVVVWAGGGSDTPQSTGVYAQIWTTSLNKLTDNLLLSDHVADDILHGSPRVVKHPESNGFLVVWRDDRSGQNRAYGRFFSSNGTPQDSSFLISDDSRLTNLWFVSTAANNSNQFAVVWGGEIDSANWVIQMRWMGSDGTFLGPSTQVSTAYDVGVHYTSVEIDFDHDGASVLVWEQLNESGHSKIHAQRFNPDRTPLGENSQLSIAEDGSAQFWPSVALHDRRIYTAWDASSQGTDRTWVSIIDFYHPSLGVGSSNSTVLSAFLLLQNYPNPFNPATTIEFSMPSNGLVTLTIYDVLGREVETILNKRVDAGQYRVQWNASNIPSGIYFIRMQSGHFTQVRKVTVLR